MRKPQEQLALFRALLQGKEYARSSEVFAASLDWVRNFPGQLTDLDRISIRRDICKSFSMSEVELDIELGVSNGNGAGPHVQLQTPLELERELDTILPKHGLLRRYAVHTEHSEAPLAYHIFSFLCGVGSVVNRRVFLNMGYYRLFPTLGILILGPSGVKKTSACNITVDLLQSLGLVKIYSEKLTPEALIDAMKGDNATGLIYAPEMAVFLNKQKYNEGLVQLITRFMDCPDEWSSGTIMRSTTKLINVAISSLMCSTLDWFIGSTPEDAFGGGFIARNLLIVQESSPRVEPIPRPGDPAERDRLIQELALLHQIEGEMTLDYQSHNAYLDWYHKEHLQEIKEPEHELMGTYYNRKADHIKRLAICIHLVTCGNLCICLDCYTRAYELLNWTEKFLPAMLRQMFRSQAGNEQEQVLRTIKAHGQIAHSLLVRRMSYRMNAQSVKNIVNSLKEARLVEEKIDNLGHWYKPLED